MSTANLSRDETAARSAAVTVHDIRVELDLTGAVDADRTGFPTVSELTFEARTDETWVDFLGEAVERVEVNGVSVPVDWDGARIRLTGLAPQNRVRIVARGAYSRSGEGLHRFVDPVDGETYLYTQYEPADSRRVMACFEQPDMKARYTFVVTAPAGWHVLSNQPAVESSTDAGAQRVRFAPTPPLSSYITAVAAGPYQRVDGAWQRDAQTIDLGVLCRRSLAAHLDTDEIIEVTRQGLDFFTDAFAFPYPWGKYDQIFVPEYNLGAMENPGLVTFTEAYVFRGAATVAQREGRANTILHEMAHMWFGDLVTMQWWDDLWLKESFADYMGAHAAVAVTRFTDAWVTFAARRKAWAYQQDQLPTTHPIVADIPDLEAAKLNFDGITYAKGAAVLKQLVAFVGEEAFFEGARRYFAAHAFGNTTLDDLLTELEAASGRDLRAWSRAWLQTTGLPTVRVDRHPLAVVQDMDRPHRMRVGFYAFEGERLTRVEAAEVDVVGEHTPIAASEVSEADLIVPNDDDRSYAKERLDARSVDAVERGLATIEDAVTRGVIWATLWNATRDGELAAERFLRIAVRHAAGETNAALMADVHARALFTLTHYVPADRRDAAASAWLQACWDAMLAAEPGSDAQLSWARALGAAAEFSDARADDLRALLAGTTPPPAGLRLDPDLRWSWWLALSATGHAQEPDIVAEYARDATATGATARIAALAARPSSHVRVAAWHAAWDDASLTNDHLSATIRGARAGGRNDLLESVADGYFDRILEVWSTRSIEIAARLVRGLFPDGETTDAVDAWLAAHRDAPGALRRIVVEQRDHLARDLRVRSVQADLV
ncbi:aminopeptidase N [Microbacterium sp. zg.Y1090]|uniref:aminopeptidase N n=1 Tax=Microbacterium wangruii TaxID=3049073 RepID=UPI00214DD205|nr:MULTISPECIES: aminopeptidase N [unclassified Microbacterium]MCR2818710.1 aminopeptidase N [Microbacterium sp. zg.Y1090]WIM27031.1 aminopeptidase N [Microbacterium sp. zg-Y1090]